ncbi:hypothetical protein POUND7_011604 [Theobroma cacao]
MSTSKFIRKVSNSLSWCQAKASTSRDRSGKVEEIDYYSPPAPFANNPAPLANHSGITRVIRDLPPAHYSFKVESFTIFAETGLEEKFESGVFEAGGYKWRLLLYPKGNKKSNGGDCISLYLQIAETEKLPPAWEVNVSFRLFVFDQIRDKYLTIEDAGAVKRFHQMKTEWGFDQLLFLESFNDPSNGYLVDDSYVFGAEVFVIEQTRKLEFLFMINQPHGNPITFKIEKFSKLDEEKYDSQLQTVAGLKWRIRVYPNGTGRAKGAALSLYLGFYQQSDALSGRSLYVKFKLCLMDQIVSNYKKITGMAWFTANKCLGYSHFESLENLRIASTGFLLNDALTVQAEIILLSNFKCFS